MEKKSDEQQCKEYLTSYKIQKCRRTVLPHWSKNRPWLRVESTPEHDMFCDYCVKAGVSGDKCNFVRGCPSM